MVAAWVARGVCGLRCGRRLVHLQRVPGRIQLGCGHRARDLRGARAQVALVHDVVVDGEGHHARRAVLRRVRDEGSALPLSGHGAEVIAVQWNLVADGGRSIPFVRPVERAALVDRKRFVLADAPEYDFLPPGPRIEGPGAVLRDERDGKGPVLRAQVEYGSLGLAGETV